jgi:EAL domain-containing protein (putative c-di-GMP-specific phosphodiesterase class I)
LRKIPFKELKIDQSFVTPSDRDAEARTIVESIAGMAKNLGMTLVAEGIESKDNWDLLVGLGCDEGQGYFISRPLPADQVMEWVRNWRPPGGGAA